MCGLSGIKGYCLEIGFLSLGYGAEMLFFHGIEDFITAWFK